MSTQLSCYRKGCSKSYDPEQNVEGCCQYHPGEPVFHDAMKKWSCCDKRSYDFTECLQLPGCTFGIHSNERPAPMPKAEPVILPEEAIVRGPPPKKPQNYVRPSKDDKLKQLTTTTTDSLAKELQKKMSKEVESSSSALGDVKLGQPCSNSSCGQHYNGPESNNEDCFYHPGQAIFHEGMKYWSCCQKKTPDFDSFMSQAGCEKGKHNWEPKKRAQCRYDWHQTSKKVVLTVYAKCPDPTQTRIRANRVYLDINVVFGDGLMFMEKFELEGEIDVDRSTVKLKVPNVEIELHKASPHTWAKLKYEAS